MISDQRTPDQIREHYEIEKELANQLRFASKQERRQLYSILYDQLYLRVPLHPQLTRKSSSLETAQAVSSQMKFLKRFINEDAVFLEVGPGDCALSFEVAKLVKQVYAIDVSDKITKSRTTPKNCRLILSDGCNIPVSPNSVNVAYSYQLMEHLHPEDAVEQLQHIYNAIIPGGIYICVTPNRLKGPHDVSQYFDKVATGFHLKEYTTLELRNLFRTVGFSQVRAWVGVRGNYISLPVFPIALLEIILDGFPYSLRSLIARNLPCRSLLGIRLVGTK